MKTIHKFSLEVTDTQQINIPKDAEILSAQLQIGDLCVWVKLDSSAPTRPCTIKIHGTGHQVDPDLDLRFIDTVQLAGRVLVFHVFYVA